MEKYGFVYLWLDKKHNKFYVGSHWGTEDDGYICSSKTMLKAHKRRPQDFKRRILSRIYTDRQGLLHEEQRFLDMIDRDHFGSRYYNINAKVQGYWWVNEETKKQVGAKISTKIKELAWTSEYRENYLNGLKTREDVSQRPEVRAKRSVSMKITMAEKFPIENRYVAVPSQSEEHRCMNSLGNLLAWQNMTEETRLQRSAKISAKLKGNTAAKGMLWWNNGQINKRSKECPGPQWSSGRLSWKT